MVGLPTFPVFEFCLVATSLVALSNKIVAGNPN